MTAISKSLAAALVLTVAVIAPNGGNNQVLANKLNPEQEILALKEQNALQQSQIQALQAQMDRLLLKLNQDDCPCDLSGLEANIESNAEDITRNTVTIESLRSDVDDAIENTNNLLSTVTDLSGTVGAVQQIANSNKDAIAGNTASIQETVGKIDQLREEVNNLVNTEINGIKEELSVVTNEIMPPIGTVMGWFARMDKNDDPKVDLPARWQRADNSAIGEGSPFTGRNTPPLNTEKRFLKASTFDASFDYFEHTLMQHEHNTNDPGHGHVDTDCGFHRLGCVIEDAPTDLSVTTVKQSQVGEETAPRHMTTEYIVRVR